MEKAHEILKLLNYDEKVLLLEFLKALSNIKASLQNDTDPAA